MDGVNQWDATLYDDKHAYVAEYGKGVLELLYPQKGESIVDLGCGTGDLTKEIAESRANVIGIDASKQMLEKAADKYPYISFLQADANTFQLEAPCDAIFSNAVLHWIQTPEQVIESVYANLKHGGRFVAEFGGKGNIAILLAGILDVLTKEYHVEEQEVKERMPWYFPSIGQYSQLLEKAGFHVTFANHFDRPTILLDGEHGLRHWLESFAEAFFPEFEEMERMDIYERVKERVRPFLFKKENWVVDYKRLRIVAVK